MLSYFLIFLLRLIGEKSPNTDVNLVILSDFSEVMREGQKEAFQEKQKKNSNEHDEIVEFIMQLEVYENDEVINSPVPEVRAHPQRVYWSKFAQGIESLLLIIIPFCLTPFRFCYPHSILIVLQITPRALQFVLLNLLISFLLQVE